MPPHGETNPTCTLTADCSGEEAPFSLSEHVAVGRGDKIGRFIVLGSLGDGGMGIVLKAYDPELDRAVAIKILRRDTAQSRFAREARALARLGHPNVVAIYDVGSWEGRFYLAMEHVDGPTLGEWIARERPSYKRILSAFLQAGRALGAAHAVGIVHRDFKPRNALIGEDGRVRVVDFGIARALGDEPSARRPAATPVLLRDSSEELTRTGRLMGTPAYMAPEQFAETTVDARADQYSFCVTLYEVLYGHRPFRGQSFEDLRDQVLNGSLPDEGGELVSPRTRAVLERGLSRRPADRFASMEALCSALQQAAAAPRRTRWWMAACAAAVAVGVGAWGVGAAGIVPNAACTGSERHWDGVWDHATAQAVRDRLVETGKPYAGETFERIAAGMHDYRETWTSFHRDTCRATHVFGEQSGAELDRRMACLDRNRDKAEAFVAKLGGAKAIAILDNATYSLHELSAELGGCADKSLALTGMNAAAQREHDELLREHDRLDLILMEGRYSEVKTGAEALGERARQLGDIALEADALELLASSLTSFNKPDETERHFRSALRLAARLGDAKKQARLWMGLSRLVSNHGGDADRAAEILFSAELAVEASGEPELRLRLLNELSDLARVRGDYEASLEQARAALAFSETVPERATYLKTWRLRSLQAQAHKQVSMALALLGRAKEAVPHAHKEYKLRRDNLGERHPHVAYALTTVGGVLVLAGDYPAAVKHCRRAKGLLEAALGPNNFATGMSYYHLAEAAFFVGDDELARVEASAAVATLSERVGRDHPTTLASRVLLAAQQMRTGDANAGVENATTALKVLRDSPGGEHSALLALQHLARAHRRAGRLDDAERVLREGEELARETQAAGERWRATMATERAELELASSRPLAAVPLYLTAIGIYDDRETPADLIAAAEAGLARALWTLGDREDALVLGRRARRRFVDSGVADRRDAREFSTWLRERDAEVNPRSARVSEQKSRQPPRAR